MTPSEFNELKAICRPRTLYRHHSDNQSYIELAVGGDGHLQYAVHLDMHGALLENVPQHPLAIGLLATLPCTYA